MNDESQPPLKPPFDEEFPNSERDLPDHIERAVEQGTMTPAMVGYRSKDSSETEVPLSSKEVDEVRKAAKRLAKRTGKNPDDFDWRFQ